jgi:hypothetical protein
LSGRLLELNGPEEETHAPTGREAESRRIEDELERFCNSLVCTDNIPIKPPPNILRVSYCAETKEWPVRYDDGTVVKLKAKLPHEASI